MVWGWFERTQHEESVSFKRSVCEVFPSFLIAGLGMVCAGLLLDDVQHWKVFQEVSEFFIIVPPLLGLKGNLEMTLAARLSTAANLGKLDKKSMALSLIAGNLVLVQCQGIVIGFLAAASGIVLGWDQSAKFDVDQAVLICASAMVTASLASLILGVLMVAVIVLTRKLSCNPDNVATPIAASLGDVTTLSLLAWTANFLYREMLLGTNTAWITLSIYFLVLPLLMYLAFQNPHSSQVLVRGWTPILLAMLISCGGGVILDKSVEHFKGIALFLPVMNGAGGNLVAIQASRMTTYLHRATNSLYGTFPCNDDQVCVLPCLALCGSAESCRGRTQRGPPPHGKTALVLLLLLAPGHLIFIYCISAVEGTGSPTLFFITLYLIAAYLQVLVLLYLCQILVYWMWSNCCDPDNAAIPYLTSIGDLLGTGFLSLVFIILHSTDDTYFQRIAGNSHLHENITKILEEDLETYMWVSFNSTD